MSEQSDYYCYALYAPDDNLEHPRYVGKGRGRRAINNQRGQRSKRVRQWIEELGEEPFFDIIAANLTESEAFALEIELIAKYGREGIDEGGVLLNVSTGGAGAAGVKLSEERLAALSIFRTAANLGRKASDVTRARMSAAHKGKQKSPEHIAKVMAAIHAANAAKSPEERSSIAKAREAAKTPEQRQAVALKMVAGRMAKQSLAAAAALTAA